MMRYVLSSPIKKANSGFTLIETIVYIALFSIIIGGGLVGVYQIIQGSENQNAKLVTIQEANFIIRKIEWALTGISNIDLPLAGSSGTVLRVTKSSFLQNPLEFDLSSNAIRLKRASGASAILNNSDVLVSNLNFEHIPPSGPKPRAIKTHFTVNSQVFDHIKYLRK